MAWKFFSAQGQEKQAIGPAEGYGTSLPASPADGQVYNFVADATNGVVWRMRYNAGSASAFKWEYLGGGPLVSEVFASESTTSTSYVALTTPGPSIVLPRAGDYDVRLEARMFGPESAGIGFIASMSYDIGGTGAVGNDGIINMNPVNSVTDVGCNVSGTRRKTGLTAVTLTAKYNTSSGTTTFFNARRMIVTPVRFS